MIRHTLRVVIPAFALILVYALPVQADYEAGKRAWDEMRPAEALREWRAAADGGEGRAMLALGRLYMRGLGAPQDFIEAHKWFNLAASRGEIAAAKERDALAAKMTPKQVATAQERARSWQPGLGEGRTDDSVWEARGSSSGGEGRESPKRNSAWAEPEGGRKDYKKALAHAVGEDPKASGSGDYLAVLRNLEKKERKAREEAKRKAEEERKAREEAKRKAEEERKAQEEAAKRKAEEERKAQEEAARGPSIEETIAWLHHNLPYIEVQHEHEDRVSENHIGGNKDAYPTGYWVEIPNATHGSRTAKYILKLYHQQSYLKRTYFPDKYTEYKYDDKSLYLSVNLKELSQDVGTYRSSNSKVNYKPVYFIRLRCQYESCVRIYKNRERVDESRIMDIFFAKGEMGYRLRAAFKNLIKLSGGKPPVSKKLF